MTAFPLPLLCCPLNGQPLRAATPEELRAFNAAGNRACGATTPQFDLEQPLEGLLIREDGAIGYGIVDGIPVLLPDHGFTLPPGMV